LPYAEGWKQANFDLVNWRMGQIKMTNWKTDLDALVKETMALVKNNRVEPSASTPMIEPPVPRTVAEPGRLPPVRLPKSEGGEIRERASNFKAHQERFAREREEYAASLLKRMLDPTPSPRVDQGE
jgi:hypothetical protein